MTSQYTIDARTLPPNWSYICTVDVHKMNFKDTTYPPIEPGYKESEWIHLTWIAPIHVINMYSYTLSYSHTYSMFKDSSIYPKVMINVVLFADTKESSDSTEVIELKEWWVGRECPISVNRLLMPDPCHLIGAPNSQLTYVEWIPKTLPPNQSNREQGKWMVNEFIAPELLP